MDNMRWMLQQLLKAGEATPEDGFKDWLEGEMARFLDRGHACLVVNDVLPAHVMQYVLVCMHVGGVHCVCVCLFVCLCSFFFLFICIHLYFVGLQEERSCLSPRPTFKF